MSGPMCSYLKSSIGKKKIMGLSGLFLALFVLTHMAGNLLLFVGPGAYNKYGHGMVSNPAFPLIEASLFLIFFIHIGAGISLVLQNKAARSQSYAVSPQGEKDASLASKTMAYTGIIVGIFVVHHLITFRFGPVYQVSVEGTEMRDLYRVMLETFSHLSYVIWYVVAVFLLGFHLSHGVWSCFQSLGLMNHKVAVWAKKVAILYGILIALGFASQPLYVFFHS